MPARVAEGQELFLQYCVVCPPTSGGGSVGPNLTDAYWIHGGRPMDHHDVITNGVLAKGMAAWGNQLGPTRVESVVAYIMTLRNTEVPGKAPEGEFYGEARAEAPRAGRTPETEAGRAWRATGD